MAATLRRTAVLGLLVVLGGAACALRNAEDTDTVESAAAGTAETPVTDAEHPLGSDIVIVPEAWVTPWDDTPNLDSPAFWSGPDGDWIITTGKESHDLWVHDAASGELIRRVGGPGSGPGQFLRPNGIAVVENVVLVVERDNHRVQALSLPDFEPLTTFGEAELVQPYGIAFQHDGGALDVFITDDYDNDEDRPDTIPPAVDFTDRVKHYQLRLPDEGWNGMSLHPELVRHFGDAEGEGALRVVESIQIDPDQDVLLIADEFGFELEMYDLEGRYLDRTVASDVYRYGDPEGIMLYRCGPAEGYWILTDQGSARTVFHVLDRASFEPIASFAGQVTANTDGIWLTQETVPGLGQGALFALHDDGGLTAFAWADIADALGLRTGCMP